MESEFEVYVGCVSYAVRALGVMGVVTVVSK